MMRKFDSTFSIGFFIERLIATQEWKNLRDKTQVFNERVSESVKSRGSHCDDVGDIAYKLCESLDGDSLTCEKAKLIGLIHDLGHIPYGHAGEAVASSIIKNYEFSEMELAQIAKIRKNLFGEEYADKNSAPCFEHNENSVLQYITLCNRFGFEIDEEIIIGILSHSTSRYEDLPINLSQQSVRLADKLAYINYDVDDLFLSFYGKEEELDALERKYREPLLDPSGNEIKIPYNGKEYTIYEFLTQLSSEERIKIFIDASIEDAKLQSKKDIKKYENYESVLTGCNDIAVEIAGLRKKQKKATTEEEKKRCFDRIDELRRELYKRSPILYAAYEIKDRSDDFIRSGVGLTKERQEERSRMSLSAVGNQDLMNEYFYKTLVLYLQKELKNNEGLTEEQIIQKYKASGIPQSYIDLYFEYLDFKQEQNSAIANIPGNDGTLFPEIYTIVNFIGIHSNTQLTSLAKTAGLDMRFRAVVLPEIRELINNPQYYDKETGRFTKNGDDERKALVSKYGAQIKLDFGLEEESKSSVASDESIERTINAGYDIPDYVPGVKPISSDLFKEISSKEEKRYIEQIRVSALQQNQESLENGGKKL